MNRLLAVVACLTACTGGRPSPPGGVAVIESPGEAAATVEWCNGLDDNQDGFADERYECTRGRREACVTPCSSWGVRDCTEACTWSDCLPGGEVCNGLDDDCDGQSDEDFGCVRGVVTLCDVAGGPARGVMGCDEQCVPGACTPLGREVCNGEDDDGDGLADEDFECVLGTREVCDAALGTDRMCSTICTWGPCGKAEVCNHVDDDGDGKTDEGFDLALTRQPFDVPDMSGPGEYAGSAWLHDCSDDEVVVVTKSQVDGRFGPEGRRVFVHRLSLDGAPVHDPVQICAPGPDEYAWAPDNGYVRLWDDLVVASCARVVGFGAYDYRLYFIDRRGNILNGPDGDGVNSISHRPCQIGIGSDRLVWIMRQPESGRMVLRTYGPDGRLVTSGVALPYYCHDNDVELIADERGHALYLTGGSEYIPDSPGIWRVYVDLDSGAILSRQELIPGRMGVENVIDGPGRTLVEYSGGVRAVFDDNGQMVGNKIFLGQGPNPLAHLRGRTIGTSFYNTFGLNGLERITFDGRYGGFASWRRGANVPELDALGAVRESTCVTPSGAYVSMAFHGFGEPGAGVPLQRVYVSDCPN